MENSSYSGSTSSSHDQNFLKARRDHTSPKQFICDVCGNFFNRKDHLIRHQRIHTGEKPFTCNECKTSFNNKFNLVKHQRVHTGEKPFACDECKKTFIQKSHLKQHQRVHTGEKPFTCDECKKSFIQKSVLIIHQRIHTSVKSFSCNECGKCFRHKISLRKHIQVHGDQEKSSFSETEKCKTVRSHSKVSKVTTSEKSHIFRECGKASALEGVSDCQEESYVCVSFCKLCGEGLKGSGCHNQVCQMASGELDDDVKNGNLLEDTGKELHEEISVKDEIVIDEILFESQVSEKFEHNEVKNVVPLYVGKEMHEGVFVKDEIDSDEIPSENQVREEFEFILFKSEPESD